MKKTVVKDETIKSKNKGHYRVALEGKHPDDRPMDVRNFEGVAVACVVVQDAENAGVFMAGGGGVGEFYMLGESLGNLINEIRRSDAAEECRFAFEIGLMKEIARGEEEEEAEE